MELNGAAQIIFATGLGIAAILRALALLLTAWRDRKPRIYMLLADPPCQTFSRTPETVLRNRPKQG